MSSDGSDPTCSVAVLGTGLLGGAIATRLAREGFRVRVWNRTASKARELEALGCKAADSPAEAVAEADVVLSVLADGTVTEALLLGEGGVVEALAPATVTVQMGTVGVTTTGRLVAGFAERGQGFLDAPVSGSREPALAGELTVMASGAPELRARVEPVFDALARRILWLERPGEGTRLKLAVNGWLAMTLEALAESVGFCRAVGVDPEGFFAVLEGGPLDMPYVQSRGRTMDAGMFLPPNFPLALLAKDADLALAATDKRSTPPAMPVLRAVADQAHALVDAGYGDEDMTALYRASRPN